MSFRATSILVSLVLASCAGAPPEVPSTPIGAAASKPTVPPRVRPCAATTRILKGAKQGIEATAYVSHVTKAQSGLAVSIEALFADYTRASGGLFHGKVVDASEGPARERAKEMGLFEHVLDGEDDDSPRAKRGYVGIVVEHGAERDSIKSLPPDAADDLEYWLSTKIREIRERSEGTHRTFGVVTRAAEPPLTEPLLPQGEASPQLRKIVDQYFPMYRFADVDLARGPVPDGLAGLFVFQPERELDAAELRRIDDFVMLGKPVAVVASAVNVKAGDPKMLATLSTRGLEKLAEGYGVEMKRDVVIDYGRQFTVAIVTSSQGPQTARFPQLVRVLEEDKLGDAHMLDTRFAPFFRIPEIVLPLTSTLVVHAEKQPAAKIRVVARSTPRSTRETGAEVDLSPLQRWKVGGEMASSVIGAVVEGKLASAFDPSRHAASDARVFFLSSAHAFGNPFARAFGGNPLAGPSAADDTVQQLAMPYAQAAITTSILVFKNTLDWMADGELAACALDAR